MSEPSPDELTVVGVGADGWPGLAPASQGALLAAEVVLGGPRQLDLLPTEVRAERHSWPTPLLPALPGVLDSHRGKAVAVLASGDPMLFGIGSTVIRLRGAGAVRVLPHPSSVSLACARLGWPVEDVEIVSLVGRPAELLHPAIQPGRRVLALVGSSSAAAEIDTVLAHRGFGPSEITVLEQLGGPLEHLAHSSGPHDRLAIVAIACRAEPTTIPLPRTPGLPDSAFENDGQLTKREIRAYTLAALAPVPGQLLWDVGAGSGSVGIEWMRTHPACRALAVEPRADRRALITANASALGTPGLQIVAGSAPEALAELPAPDAVFVGGAVSVPGVLEASVAALAPGGRLVANGVTVDTESVLARWHAELGGDLVRIAVQRAAPIGRFTGWRPAMPVTQWAYVKGDS